MIFEFVLLKLPERLVFFDLLILVFKVFEKIWIWYFTLKKTQINFIVYSIVYFLKLFFISIFPLPLELGEVKNL